MNKFLYLLIGSALLSFGAHTASAQTESNPDQGYTRFDEYTVYYSVFNSTMVKAEVARLHEITRGGNQALVNVALVANDSSTGGEAAKVTGSATNLMQQRRELKFAAITEDNVTYYLAPLRISDEEVVHFTIDVEPKGVKTRPYTVKFSKKLYVDR